MKPGPSILFALLVACRAFAGDCQLATSVCVDTTSSKTISGVTVTLADVGGCWEYEDTYTCLKPQAIDYCSALSRAGCGQIASTCSDTAFNGSCNTYTKTFQCAVNQGLPSDTIRLSDSHTLTTDVADARACSSYAQNSRCRLAAHTCVDSTPCRLDGSGATVCLAGVTPPPGGLNSTATCWQYRDDYSCIADDPIDYCAAIRATDGCAAVGSQCDATAFDGSCNQYRRTYQCTNATVATSPPTVVALDTSYTIASNTLDISACTSLTQSSNCVHAAHACSDHTPCKTINGLQVCLNTVSPLPAGAQSAGDSCWSWSEDYSCAATTLSDDCQELIDGGCRQVGSECLDRAVSGACEMSERRYACQASPATTTQRTVCDRPSVCPSGAGCFDSSHPADEDFGRVVATLEAAREAGVYGADQRLFTGVAEQCRKKLFGLVNCCRKGGGGTARSNNALLSAALQGASAAGQVAVNAGSKYVFDFMYPQYAGYVEAGAQALISSEVLFTPTNFQPSFSFYGLTLSTGTMTTGMLGGPIYSLGTVGPFNFYFDPYSLAITVAIQLISELLSCEEAEKLLAMHREANLCVAVGSFCSRRVPIIRTCIEQTQSYCCFNSRLARIINERGRAQLGKGWGSGKHPDCSGFTPEEFERIDFSRIDLSEFIAEVVASVRLPDAAAIGRNVQGTVQQRVESYYRR